MAPQQALGGRDLYESLEEKAAFLFYSINKRQIFLNGNKRMSTLCLLVFLGINGKLLQLKPDELTEKALWLANTPSLDFPTIKTELAIWIRERFVDLRELSADLAA
ncbi:Fic family protein [Mesorhizobium sp. B1-1-8]|nr:Fic family protein [Mesorhizobium sp. B1-1-8]